MSIGNPDAVVNMNPQYVTQDLAAVPISHLVGGPLQAVYKTQSRLAYKLLEFIKEVALFVDDDSQYQATTIKFEYIASYDESGDPIKSILNIPLITLIHIPSLQITKFNYSFEMEINSTTEATHSYAGDQNVTAGGGGFAFIAQASTESSVSGQVSSSNKRDTNQSATYAFELDSENLGYTEGLKKVIDILDKTIQDVKI